MIIKSISNSNLDVSASQLLSISHLEESMIRTRLLSVPRFPHIYLSPYQKHLHLRAVIFSTRKMRLGTVLVALALAAPAAARYATPKKSTKPPLGWSSWYAFGGCGQVSQTKMEQTFEKLVNRSVVIGSNKSLHDVGYQFANLDDGWQDCGQGVNGGFHDKDGVPMMNPTTFPNVTAMTAKVSWRAGRWGNQRSTNAQFRHCEGAGVAWRTFLWVSGLRWVAGTCAFVETPMTQFWSVTGPRARAFARLLRQQLPVWRW